MNENIDLVKILDGCPLGTKLYSPLFGEVTFAGVNTNGFIGVYTRTHKPQIFESNGKYRFDNNSSSSECLIFPSKYQQDWAKFERFWDKPKGEKFSPNTLQPFDKVLVRDYRKDVWTACLFSHPANNLDEGWFVCDNTYWHYIIPYNEETKHLLGTNEDCPEYYKWWD